MDNMAKKSGNAKQYLIRVAMAHEAEDDAVPEFLDGDFLSDWRVIEESFYLAFAISIAEAKEMVVSDTSGDYRFVNLYGQVVKRSEPRILSVQIVPQLSFELESLSDGLIELYFRYYLTNGSTQLESYLTQRSGLSSPPKRLKDCNLLRVGTKVAKKD